MCLWDDNMIFVLIFFFLSYYRACWVFFFFFFKPKPIIRTQKIKAFERTRRFQCPNFRALISKAHYLSLFRKAWSYGCSSCWHGRHTTPMGVQLVTLSLSLLNSCSNVYVNLNISVILSLSVNWVFWALMLFSVFFNLHS